MGSLVGSVASSAPISLVNSAFLQRDGQKHTEEFFQGCALSHCPHLTNSFKHRYLSCLQELILGVDASQRQALNLPPQAEPGILQWMSSFYDFLEVRGRISKAMTLGERSALSPARDWPRLVVFAKPTFYGASVTWWKPGWLQVRSWVVVVSVYPARSRILK